MKLVIDADIPFIKGVLEPYCEVAYIKGTEIDRDDVADSDAIIVRTRTRCDRKLLEGSRVRLIATATIGYDHIDMDYCASAGIEVATAAGSNARGVLQWVAAVLVSLGESGALPAPGSAIGVIGTGNVGSLIGKYAENWGFRVMCCDPPLATAGKKPVAGERFFSFEEVTAACNIISFHVPLVNSGEYPTWHMADNAFFRTVKPGTVILNSSRGEVTDTVAFRDAVERRHVAAAVDTWENEPRIDAGLLAAVSVATPHIAGYTRQGKANASAMVVDAVSRYFGLPLEGWFPSDEVQRTIPRMITWEELRNTIGRYFDIRKETGLLKANPEGFERMRNEYVYREEYF